MSKEANQRRRTAKDLFIAALDKSGEEERTAFLDRESGGDRKLRARVEALLEAHLAEDGFLERPADESLATAAPAIGTAEGSGTVIGRYKLLEKLGEGGFGAVWAADQREPVRRRVALKIIKLGMDTRQVVARFEAERQALALMDHPNIAKVLDAGATTETGRPFFVMELVRGIPITQSCNDQKLPLTDRLDLFIRVCHAIQHAHQKGIIHRDIKPSNVMVTLHDGVPVPKVIDFGIAKATQAELTEKTIYTQYHQFIGTPAYMSPEQAEMSGLDIDTRSDVYSLGVLLYELLTATTPFDGNELIRSGLDEMRRIIREREPMRPSTRMRRTSEGANGRPSGLRGQDGSNLPTDLDWIVMKCLEKDRTRRYETANGLASDINRHLANEAVLARPPSATYKFSRFARRNRAALVTTAAFAVLLLVLGFGGSILAIRERAARESAETARRGERRLNFTMALDRGLMLCDQARVGAGMLWLVRALELAPKGADAMERVIRANLTAWRRELHALEGMFPHEQSVVCVTFSPDGRYLLTGSHDGVAQLWDRRTGEPAGAPMIHGKEVHEAMFREDGRSFVTLSFDGTARIWDTDSRRLVRSLQHDSPALAAVLLPDGGLVTSTSNGRVRIWAKDRDDPVAELPRHAAMVHDLDLTADQRRLLTACDDGQVRLWDLESHRLVGRIPHPTRVITAQLVGPDRERVATADADGRIVLWDWSDEDGDGVLEGVKSSEPVRHRGLVHRLRANHERLLIGTASFDNHAHLVDVVTERPTGFSMEHSGGLQGIAFSRDGLILTACDDTIARLWRPAPTSLLREIPFKIRGSRDAVFTSDGRHVMIPDGEGRWTIHRTTTSDSVGRPIELSDEVYACALTPDESRMMTGGSLGIVRMWDLTTGRRIGESWEHPASVWRVAASHDGRRMVSACQGGVVVLWDTEMGVPIRTVTTLPEIGIHACAFNPDDASIVAIGCGDKVARLIDLHRNAVVRKLEGHRGRVETVAFSPDGTRLVTGSLDNTLRVWDVATGDPVSKPMLNDGPFLFFADFDSTGTIVVGGCDDGTARVWDVATSRPIGPRLVHDSALRATAFREGDREIMTGTPDGVTRFWDVPTDPEDGDVPYLRVELEVATGMTIDEGSGELRVLTVDEWRERRKAL